MSANSAIFVNPITLRSIASPVPPRGFVLPSDSNQTADLWDAVTGTVYLGLDATLLEEPTFEARPSQSPVEDGSEISDNVALMPMKVNIKAIVTDTPISIIAPYAGSFATPKPSVAAFNYLRQLLQNRLPFDYIGSLGTFKSVVLSSFKATRDPQTGDALHFEATLEQVVIVYSELVPVTHFANKTSAPKQSKGVQAISGLSTNQQTVVDATGNSLTGLPGIVTGFQ